MKARGAAVVLGSLVVLGLLALAMRYGLREVSRGRFIVTVSAVPPAGRLLPLDQPLRVAAVQSRRQAGAAPADRALFALLLGGDGAILQGPRPMAPAPPDQGRPTWEVVFPPLGRAPKGATLVAVVAQLPTPAPDAGDAEARRRLGAAARPMPGEAHPEVFGRLLAAARALGGHAEMATVAVRAVRSP